MNILNFLLLAFLLYILAFTEKYISVIIDRNSKKRKKTKSYIYKSIVNILLKRQLKIYISHDALCGF